MSGRVIVVGSVNVDLVVTTEWLPGPGETVIGGRFARHHGGKGGNQAVAAARLGATTVSPGPGRWSVWMTRSMLTDPTTMTRDMPATSR